MTTRIYLASDVLSAPFRVTFKQQFLLNNVGLECFCYRNCYLQDLKQITFSYFKYTLVKQVLHMMSILSPMNYILSFDINWVTVTQVSKTHSPVFDLAVRHLDKYTCRMWVSLGQCYVWYLSNSKLVDGKPLTQIESLWPKTLDIKMAASNSKVSYNLQIRVAIPNLKLVSLSIMKTALDPDTVIWPTWSQWHLKLGYTPEIESVHQGPLIHNPVKFHRIWEKVLGSIMYTRMV